MVSALVYPTRFLGRWRAQKPDLYGIVPACSCSEVEADELSPVLASIRVDMPDLPNMSQNKSLVS